MRRVEKETASSSKDPEPAVTAPKPAGPAPLTAQSLERVPSQGVLIRCPDKSESPGLLLKSGTSSAARMEYFIVGSTPADAEKIRFACKASDQVLVASATRAAVLPNGLSVYSFTSGKSLTVAISEPPAATGPMYACRIEGRGSDQRHGT